MLRVSPVWLVTVGAGTVIAAAGLLFGRPDVVALAVPFLVLTLLGSRTAPVNPQVDVAAAAAEPGRLTVPVHCEPGDGSTLLALSVRAPGYPWRTHLIVPQPATVTFQPPASGEAVVGEVRSLALAPDGLRVTETSDPATVSTFVLPQEAAARTPVAPTPPRLARNPGSHRARFAGAGSDPKDIRIFTPSDSLRSIDWRATARSPRVNEFLVRERFAESQGTVRIVVDVGADLGWNPLGWFRPQRRTLAETSLLGEVRLASLALARAHLAAGDRVGLSDITGLKPVIRAATGMRQLDRLRAYLAHLGVVRTTLLPPRIAPPEAGALIYVVSGFLEPLTVDRCLRWSRHGHRVVALDIGHRLDDHRPALRHLGRPQNLWYARFLRLVDPDRLTPGEANTARVLLAGRTAHLGELRRAHIPVLKWSHPAALGADLRRLDESWRRARTAGVRRR